MIDINKKIIKDFFKFSTLKVALTFIMVIFPLIHVREIFHNLVMIDMRPLTSILFFPYYKFVNLFMQFIEVHFSCAQDSIYPFLFFPFFLFYCYFLSCVFSWLINKFAKQVSKKYD